ncbi:MAG: GIDE domain-containing protein [Syntrophomonadaceae bacterium]
MGEAFMENGQLWIGKPSNSKKPFIVSVKNESELLIQSNKFAEKLAFIGGIDLAVIGVAIMLFG